MRNFYHIVYAIAVGVSQQWVSTVLVHFLAIRNQVGVTVGKQRIGAQGEHFLAIGQPVTVGVGVVGIGLQDVGFLGVAQAIAIGVAFNNGRCRQCRTCCQIAEGSGRFGRGGICSSGIFITTQKPSPKR